MNATLPSLKGREVVRALERAGFVVVRVSGSHHMMARADDPRHTVTVPVHGGRDLKAGTIRGIIRQAGMTIEEFRDLL